MIELHRLHGNGAFVVNADLIETIEACPDTVVTMVTKRRFVVEDTVTQVIDKVVAYRSRIAGSAGGHAPHSGAAAVSHDDHAAAARALAAMHDQEHAA